MGKKHKKKAFKKKMKYVLTIAEIIAAVAGVITMIHQILKG